MTISIEMEEECTIYIHNCDKDTINKLFPNLSWEKINDFDRAVFTIGKITIKFFT